MTPKETQMPETETTETTTTDDGPWYGKYGLTDEGHVNIVKQYNMFYNTNDPWAGDFRFGFNISIALR